MTTTARPDSRRRILAAAAVALAVAGLVLLVMGLRGPAGPPQPGALPASVPSGAPAETPAGEESAAEPGAEPAPAAAPAEPAAPAVDFGPILPGAVPVGLTIPAIGLSTDVLVPLTVGADGILPAPTDYATAGWHTRGPTPGQFGPAVIAGHVDGPDGPAIFYRLGELAAGDEVQVAREDGSLATFVVDSIGRYAKAEFPTALVYGNTTGRAELRLITCGGAFDRTTGHYVDNVVVFAHLVS